jgi:hypothetical protein
MKRSATGNDSSSKEERRGSVRNYDDRSTNQHTVPRNQYEKSSPSCSCRFKLNGDDNDD